MGNGKKKFSESIDLYSEVITTAYMAFMRVNLITKDAEFYRDFITINLHQCQNAQ
jgi:hypothetical protein